VRRKVGPTRGFAASSEVGPGPLSVYCRSSTPHISFNPRQGEGRASVHYHVPCGSEPYLPANAGLGAATCHTALDPASLFGRALMLPCVTWLRTPLSCSGGLQCCHVPHDSGHCLPAREGSGTVTCLTTLRGSHTLRIKKDLSYLPMQS
jgi:hypothetical protein